MRLFSRVFVTVFLYFCVLFWIFCCGVLPLFFRMPSWLDVLTKDILIRECLYYDLPHEGTTDALRLNLRSYFSTLQSAELQAAKARIFPDPAVLLPKPDLRDVASNTVQPDIEPVIAMSQTTQPVVSPNISVPNNSVQKNNYKIFMELIRKVRNCDGSNPEHVYEFLLKLCSIYEFHLVNDEDFLNGCLIRTDGSLTRIWSECIQQKFNWMQARCHVMKYLLPSRLMEDFVVKFITRRFQKSHENLSDFISQIHNSARLLSYNVSEERLIDIILQNMSPSIRSHLIFSSKPNTISELYHLAQAVSNSEIAEAQRENFSVQSRANLEPVINNTVSSGNIGGQNTRQIRCWRCRKIGHTQSQCNVTNPVPQNKKSMQQHSGN